MVILLCVLRAVPTCPFYDLLALVGRAEPVATLGLPLAAERARLLHLAAPPAALRRVRAQRGTRGPTRGPVLGGAGGAIGRAGGGAAAQGVEEGSAVTQPGRSSLQ